MLIIREHARGALVPSSHVPSFSISILTHIWPHSILLIHTLQSIKIKQTNNEILKYFLFKNHCENEFTCKSVAV